MINTSDLATKIFDDLNDKGADLGNVSIILIQNTLNKAFESKPVYSEKNLEDAFEFGKEVVVYDDIEGYRSTGNFADCLLKIKSKS